MPVKSRLGKVETFTSPSHFVLRKTSAMSGKSGGVEDVHIGAEEIGDAGDGGDGGEGRGLG